MGEMISTIDGVIAALGGTSATARIVNRTAGAVSNWKRRNRLPAELFYVIRSAVRERGQDAPPELFGIEEIKT
jgi:hypothetical protein